MKRAAFLVSENISMSPIVLVFGVVVGVTMVAMAILSCADSGEVKKRHNRYGDGLHGGHGGQDGGGACGTGGGGG